MKQITRTITKVRIVKDAALQEYCVKAYDAEGKRYPEADYYTDDKSDAEGTAKLMLTQR